MRARHLVAIALAAACAGALAACGTSSDALCEFTLSCQDAASPADAMADADAAPTHDGPDVDAGAVDAADAAPDAYVPADAGPCDVTGDPYDGCFATDETGIFVSAAAQPIGADGSKAMPFAQIGDAIAALRGAEPSRPGRIYVCQGEYSESVLVDDLVTEPLTIFGSLRCDTWSYDGRAKVRVVTRVGTPALSLKGPAVAIGVHDVAFEAPAAQGLEANGAGSTAVAARVVAAVDVTFVRVSLKAGDGAKGADGATDSTNATSDPRDGIPASGSKSGPGVMCTCGASPDTSTGGTAGPPDPISAVVGGVGGASPPAFKRPSKPGYDGLGGQAFVAGSRVCEQGHVGADGAGGASGPGAQGVGALGAGGWVPRAGDRGGNGEPGQGGGGGGGGSASGSGGGACGGCGGAGGLGGGGGGASIALFMEDANVSLSVTDPRTRSLLTSGAGGAGGRGGAGEVGQMGGMGGVASGADACSGGDGASGGGGGGGGGGSGGPSIGIAYAGTAPLIDGVAVPVAVTLPGVLLGAPGAGGRGGDPGPAATTRSNTGLPGVGGGVAQSSYAQAVRGF